MNKDHNEKVLFKKECFEIQGAVFDVYREMGSGFLESVYQECMETECKKRGIPFRAQSGICLKYKGETLSHRFKADLICYDSIILELKAVKATAPEHQAQLMNYLKATGHRLGLLVNFGAYPKATVQRIIL